MSQEFEHLKAEEPLEDVEKAWEEEIERRIKLLDEGVTKTIPWEEARKILLGKRQKRNPGP
ncbi:MAG TPA: addiction module protein [Thermoanaerobaculia bacterium]